jgi:hypothetical protein
LHVHITLIHLSLAFPLPSFSPGHLGLIKLERAEKENEQLRSDILEARTRAEDLERTRVDLLSALSVATERSKQMSLEQARFMEEVREKAMQQKQRNKAEVQRLVQRTAELEQERQRSEAETAGLRAQLDAQGKYIEEQKAANGAWQQVSERLELEQIELKQRLADGEAHLDEMRVKYASKAKQAATLSAALQMQNAKVDDLTAARDDLASRLRSVSQKMSAHNSLDESASMIKAGWTSSRLHSVAVWAQDHYRAVRAALQRQQQLLREVDSCLAADMAVNSGVLREQVAFEVQELQRLQAHDRDQIDELEGVQHDLDGQMESRAEEVGRRTNMQLLFGGWKTLALKK